MVKEGQGAHEYELHELSPQPKLKTYNKTEL